MKRRISLLVCLFAMMALPASAQYQRTGPANGGAFAFYRDAGRIWMAASTGVYYSDNNAATWVFSASQQNAFNGDQVLSLASGQNQLIAGTKNHGIYFSSDGGASWSTVNNGLLTVGGNYSDVEIANSNFCVIRPDSGFLYISHDQGASWQKINTAIGNARALSLSYHNNTLYVNTSNGLFNSTDNGNTYTNINPSINSGNLYWAVDTLYAATNTGIRRSFDFGLNFSTIGLGGRNVLHVAAYGNGIYASVRATNGQDTLKYSSDGGLSFANAVSGSGVFQYRNINDLIVPGANIVCGTNYGVFGSVNGGANWTEQDLGFYGSPVTALISNGQVVQAATYPLGVFRTLDSNKTWQHNGDYSHGLAGSIQTMDANGLNIYAGDTGQFYHSSDYGITWSAGASGLPGGNTVSLYAVKTSAEVWVIQNGNLYYSINNGSSFTAIPASGFPSGKGNFITGMDSNLFAGVDGGLLYHATGTKQLVLCTGISGRVASVVYSGTAFYAGTSGSGLYSSLNGDAWTKVIPASGGVLPATINALAVDSGSIIVASDSGLYNNKTGIWMTDSLQGKKVISLLMNHGHLFAGTFDGVYSKPYPAPVNVAVPGISSNPLECTLFPNPANGKFTITLISPISGKVRICLMDMSGKLLISSDNLALISGKNDYQVTAKLVPGVYEVELQSSTWKLNKKLVMQ